MEQDEARAELEQRMQQGQLALTAAEAAEREAVLKRLGAPPWLTVMKVQCVLSRCCARACLWQHLTLQGQSDLRCDVNQSAVLC